MYKIFFLYIFASFLNADIVKPSLVEISFLDNKKIQLVLSVSIEAIMSDIGTQYQNTKDSPNSQDYDKLRILPPEQLFEKYKLFENNFLENISLKIDKNKIAFKLVSHNIDIVGYAKRPRISILTYEAQLEKYPKYMSWQYKKSYGTNAFRYRLYEKELYTWSNWRWLKNGESSGDISLKHMQFQSFSERLLEFIKIGYAHVIPLGLDHILFIIGIALSTIVWRYLLLLVSVFTLAHTITLGLSMLNIINLPSNIVEPLIALSIAYIAVENIYKFSSIKQKSIIVFLFGLLHGLGFASMLKSFDNDNAFLSTLIGFNIGVELAQISIILCVLLLIFVIKKYTNYYKLFAILISMGVATVGLYWFFDRIYF